MLSLKLFNAVLTGPASAGVPRIIDTLPLGYVISPEASHLADDIIAYYQQELLDGNQLNQTFHKSWLTVQESTRSELLAHQLLHYFSTYGLQALGLDSEELIYLPAEVCEVPELHKAPIRVIRGLTADELAEKVMDLLRSGVALAEETLDDLIALLVELDRVPKDASGIRNKEALVKLADTFGLYPELPSEFLRYLIFKATKSSLLIKNDDTLNAIKEGAFDISGLVADYGPERCAEVFLRFKPLWLAFKAHPENKATINKLAKLAKVHHQPLPTDYLNAVTSLDSIDLAELQAALAKANAFRKIRLLYALNTRRHGASHLLYRIRNGKAFVKDNPQLAGEQYPQHRMDQMATAYRMVWKDLVAGLEVAGKTFLFSPSIHYALPATEKMFVGNLPVGTQIKVDQPLTVGIYWRHEWGAEDLDLSSISLGKVGWNAAYNKEGITYSGDITDAPNGATELLRFGREVDQTQLIYLNVYSGRENTDFKLIAGLTPKVERNYMFAPDELLLEVKSTTNSRQQILGFLKPGKKGTQVFTLVNTGLGNRSVSSPSPIADEARAALFAQWGKAPMLEDLLLAAGAEVTRDSEDAYDVDLRYAALEKDSILGLL